MAGEDGLYNKVRHASEVHRQVRHYAQSFIKPGIKLTDMCEMLEETNRRLVKENGKLLFHCSGIFIVAVHSMQ